VKKPNLRRWLAGLILLLLLVVLVILVWPSHEPDFEGKPVSFWFKELCRSGQFGRTDPGRHKETAAALQALGTNAVPYLLAQAFISHEDSTGWSNVCRFLNGLPVEWRLPRPVLSWVRVNEASFALRDIKPPASQLLALMGEHLKSTNGMEHTQSLFVLGTAGEGAEQVTPYLAAAVKSSDIRSRQLAIQSLGWLGPRGEAAVPAVIELIEEQKAADSNYLAYSAAVTLGKIGGTNAVSAIPVVKEMFIGQTNWYRKSQLAVSLFRLDPTQTKAFDFLMDGLTNHSGLNQSWMSARALGEIGSTASAAVPILLQELAGTNDQLISQIPHALTNMGVAVETFLPIMKNRLNLDNDTTRYNAAARILEINPADHEAHLALMQLIQQGSTFKLIAIQALGDAGSAAAEALPLLNEQVKQNNYPAIARRAIKQIEAKPHDKN
jgi:HEAT repeat protein